MSRRNSPLALALLMAAMPRGIVWAASGEGASAAAILKLPLGARAGAMAGAYSAVAEGAEGALFNPAGLAQLPGREVHVTHHSIFAGMSLNLAAAGFELAPGRVIGMQLAHFSSGDIPVTRETAAGAFDSAASVGTYANSSMAAGITYGHSISERAAVGASLKHLRDTVGGPGGDTVSGHALDFGALYRVGNARLGAAALNVGDTLGNAKLPGALRLGVSLEGGGLIIPITTAVDFVQPLDGARPRYALGVELRPLQNVFFEVGGRIAPSSESTQSGPAYGLGFAWRAIRLQFSFTPYGDLGSVGSFALTYRFLPAQK